MEPSISQRKIAVHVQRGELFGRAHDLAEIAGLLTGGHHRLVTLTGPGGVGKTRLALAVSDQLDSTFADGVAFVELADVSEPEQVAREIARVLAMPVRESEPLDAQLIKHIDNQQWLLILDNIEQVLSCAKLIAFLVTHCPLLVILTTSRSRLRISAEHEYNVAPLPILESGNPTALAEVAERAVVRLFVERAKAVQSSFQLTDENAASVVGICRALDGLPLAIELAAARVRVLSPAAMLDRLDQRLSLLTGGARDLPLRQQTMSNAIDWSFDLLTAAEQQLFQRISLPVGSFGLDAAMALHPHNSKLVDDLESLIEKCLVQPMSQTDGEPRFQLLETIRAYGLGRLEASGEQPVVTQLLADYELRLLLDARDGWRERNQPTWLEVVRREFGTLRLLLKSAIQSDDKSIAAQIFSELDWYWEETSQYREGRGWVDQILAMNQTVSAKIESRLNIAAAGIYFRLQEGERADALSAKGLDLARQLDDDNAAIEALSIRAAVQAENGVLDRAEELYLELAERSTSIGRPRGAIAAIHNLGMLAFARGDLDLALSRHEEAVNRDRQSGDQLRLQNSLVTLAMVKYRLDDLAGMRTLITEQQEINQRRGLPGVLGATALLCAAEGDAVTASILLGAADAGTELIGISRFGSFVYNDAFNQAIASLQSKLGTAKWETCWESGRRLGEDEVQALVSGVLRRPVSLDEPKEQPASATLSARELDVLRLLARGDSNQQIADALFISIATVKVHVRSIMTKLNLGSRTAVAAYAIHNSLN